MSNFLASLNSQTFNYSFVHIRDTDSAGHSSGWGSGSWNAAAANEDGYLGDILDVVESNATLRDHTAVIVTADHGGYGGGHPSYRIESHIVPFMVWGPGVAAGADLYELNPTSRQDPLRGKISYNAAVQPIRNGDGANLALDLLGLGPIPDSSINAAQTLVVPEPSAIELALSAALLLIARTALRRER